MIKKAIATSILALTLGASTTFAAAPPAPVYDIEPFTSGYIDPGPGGIDPHAVVLMNEVTAKYPSTWPVPAGADSRAQFFALVQAYSIVNDAFVSTARTPNESVAEYLNVPEPTQAQLAAAAAQLTAAGLQVDLS